MEPLPPEQGYSYSFERPKKSSIAIDFLRTRIPQSGEHEIFDEERRSHVTLALLKEDLFDYNRTYPESSLESNPLHQRVRSKMYELFNDVKLASPLTYSEVLDRPGIPLSHSPGMPYRLTHPGSKKRDVIDAVMAEINQMSEPCIPHDTLTFARSHIAPEDEPKVRAVWAFPFRAYMLESRFVYPLIDAFTAADTPIAYGYEMMNGGMKKLHSKLASMNTFVCTDWRLYDKTIPPYLIRFAFDFLKTFIELTPEDEKIWDVIVDYFINTPVRTPDGNRYRKSGGVPSGSGFTQMIDSIVNIYIILEASLKLHDKFPDYIIVLGDDSVFSYLDAIQFSITDFSSVCLDTHGMIINQKKSIVTDHREQVTFLGYVNCAGYPGRPLLKLLRSFVHPERSDQHPADAASRALGLLYANGGVNEPFHDMMVDFVSYCQFMDATVTMNPPMFTGDFLRYLDVIGAPTPTSWILPTRDSLMSKLHCAPEPKV